MLQKVNVVMLPTEKASNLCTRVLTKELLYTREVFANHGSNINIPQHLYFTTDEEIKEGDWVINVSASKDSQFPILLQEWHFNDGGMSHLKKIVATTNTELTIEYSKDWKTPYSTGFPKIGLDFIETYVREQGKITEAMLEYDEATNGVPNGKTISWLKLRPNGAVVINPVEKKRYNEEELIDFCMKITGHTRTRESIIDELNGNS